MPTTQSAIIEILCPECESSDVSISYTEYDYGNPIYSYICNNCGTTGDDVEGDLIIIREKS